MEEEAKKAGPATGQHRLDTLQSQQDTEHTADDAIKLGSAQLWSPINSQGVNFSNYL